ncbi:MAG: hypothetical protein WAN17_14965 [Candidatus Sulfotelmatobacter sp.]
MPRLSVIRVTPVWFYLAASTVLDWVGRRDGARRSQVTPGCVVTDYTEKLALGTYNSL